MNRKGDSNRNSREAGPPLLGLSLDETNEFLLLDDQALRTFRGDATTNWSRAKQRRWLQLFEKKHNAVMHPFLKR